MVEVVEQRGSVAELHALDPFAAGPPDRPVVWHQRFDNAAIVLGSRQTPELVDAERCRAAGLDVVRRRSGGGAVLLRPGSMLWLDVVLPPASAPADVRGSMVWLGRVWSETLTELGADLGDAEVHAGGMVDTPWSDLVCFAGIGPGEVIVGGRKLVGLSQRRTRHGVRAQCLVHRRAPAPEMTALFVLPHPHGSPPEVATLADVGADPGSDAEIAERLAQVVHRRLG